MKNFVALLGLSLAAPAAFALDTTAALAAVSGSVTDVEAVAVGVISAAAVLFGISKIRQVIKA